MTFPPGAGAVTLTSAQLLYDALPTPVWLVDAAGILRLVNRAGQAATGQSGADLLGQPFSDLLHPDDRAEVLGRWQAARVSGEEVAGEFRLRGAGEEDRLFVLRAGPVSELEPGAWLWTASEPERPRDEEDAELLAALVAALHTAATPGEVAGEALSLIGPALGARSMLVVRLDGEGVRMPTIWGDTPPAIASHMTRPGLTLAGVPILARVARGGQAVYLDDYRAEPGTLASFPSLAGGFEPIRTPGGTLEGFLVTWRPAGRNVWTPGARRLLGRAAGILGLSLERADAAARLAAQNTELEARARALEGFADLTRDVGLRGDPHALVRRAQEVVMALLPPGYALYFELEGGRWRTRVQVGDVGNPQLQALNDAGFDFCETPTLYRPWQTREPLYQDEYAKGVDTPAPVVAHINTVASLPVLVHGEPVGVFVVCVFEARRWTATERAVMETVVRSLGTAVEAARGVADLARRTREVAEWRERYEVAVQGSGNVLYDWNAATGEMVYGGPLEAITGYTPGDLAGEAGVWMDLLVHPDDRPAFQEEVGRVLRERAVLHTGFRVRRRDGGVREVETDGHFLWNERGEVIRMVGLIRDVTERREAEERLRRANEELRRSNAELEQFAYVASHDLQAPLRAVTSFAELALRRYGDRLDERGQLYLRQVVEGGQHMKRLVDDLLGFSRLNTGPSRIAAVGAAGVFDRVAERLGDEVRALGGSLTRSALPCVLADPARLDQLLQNLLSNALKYRREGVAPQVHVSARRDGEMWRFAVQDNGIGIEPQYFERIFVIFQRLHGREEFDGTGIGLAVCKKIVEGHGGRLWLESRVGEGSTFFFTLPVCPPEGAGDAFGPPAPPLS